MLYTIVFILVVLWLIGFLAFHLGWILHILLVLAVIVLLYDFVTKRSV